MLQSVSCRSLARVRGAVLAALMLASAGGPTPASAQPSPPAIGPPPSPPEAPQSRENPGLVNELGKLLKDSGSLLKDPGALLPSFVRPNSKPDAPATVAAPPAPAAQPAPPAPALPAQPAPTAPAPSASPIIPAMIDGRQVCPSTASSAADCAAAATMLCRTKGYQQGRSLAVDATEKCSAKLLIPGRPREPGDCRTENFVTRAWCQ